MTKSFRPSGLIHLLPVLIIVAAPGFSTQEKDFYGKSGPATNAAASFPKSSKPAPVAGGTILGIVVPFSIKTRVAAVSVSDTLASTLTDTTNGAYILKDIPAGNYALIFIPSDPSYQKNSSRAAVSEGQITVADTTWLRK